MQSLQLFALFCRPPRNKKDETSEHYHQPLMFRVFLVETVEGDTCYRIKFWGYCHFLKGELSV